MRPTPTTSRYLTRAALIVVCSLVWPHAATATPAAEQGFDYRDFSAKVDEIDRKLSNLRRAVDRTRFDPEAWLDTLDYDAETILTAVSKEVAFQPYDGVLRGVEGALKARAGNSADQALLLAFLMRSAGYDARIVRGELTEGDAKRLLASMRASSGDAPLEALARAATAVVGTANPPPGPIADLGATTLARRADRVSGILLKTLAAADADLSPADVTDELVAATTRYFWVQHRAGPGEEWQDAHPAFDDAETPEVAPLEFFAERLPDEYLHRLTISAWLEQKLGDETTTHRLMDDFTRPVANLDGMAIRFRNHPSGLTADTLNDLDEAVRQTRILVPMLNGAVAPGARAFDLNGQRVDPFALQSPAAGLFSTLADKLKSASEGVAEDDDLVKLESMWLEFTFSAPDGSERRSRRYLIAPRSSDANERDRVWALMTDHTYLVSAGHQPLEYLADRYFATGLAGNEYLKALAHKLFSPDEGTRLPTTALPRDLGPLAQYRLMAANPEAAGAGLQTAPNLLGFRRGYRDAQTAFFGVDVVANPTGRFAIRDGKVFRDVRETVRQGVWDTVVEHVPARTIRTPVRANAVDIIEAAVDQGIELHVVTPQRTALLDRLDLSPSAIDILRGELAEGFSAIVPARRPRGTPMSGWWRVRVDSGESLGMTADGYGAEYVEYLADMVDMALGLIDAVKGLKQCEEQPTMDTKLCCLLETHINNVAGTAFGGILGNLAGTAGAVVFSTADRLTEENLVPQADANCELLPQTEW